VTGKSIPSRSLQNLSTSLIGETEYTVPFGGNVSLNSSQAYEYHKYVENIEVLETVFSMRSMPRLHSKD
jgi:hypothetical protein